MANINIVRDGADVRGSNGLHWQTKAFSGAHLNDIPCGGPCRVFLMTPCILIRAQCSAVQCSECTHCLPGAVRPEETSQTKEAELTGLSRTINTTCRPTVLHIWSAGSQVAWQTDKLHLELPLSPLSAS